MSNDDLYYIVAGTTNDRDVAQETTSESYDEIPDIFSDDED